MAQAATTSEQQNVSGETANERRETADGKAGDKANPAALLARCAGGASVGGVLALAFAPWGWAFGLLFGVAGLLLLIRGRTVRQAWYIGLACGVVWFAVALHWLRDMFGPAAVSLWALAGAFPAIFCAMLTWLDRRIGNRVPYPILAGVAWTAIEVFRSEIMAPAFGWMGLGYALVGRALPMTLASWLGGYGVSFAVVAGAAVLAGKGIREERRKRIGMSLIVTGLWGIALIWPGRVPERGRTVTARLVQANSEDEESLFGLSSVKAGAARPDVIVWPEYSFVSDPTRQPKLWAKLRDVPRQNGCWFLFGAKESDGRGDDAPFRNTAFLMDAGGNIVGRHVKNHTVPFIRDGIAGRAARAFDTPFGRAGIAICFDMDMPDVARRVTSDGAEFLLIPSDNPAEWGAAQHRQHVQVFQMRAAESGRWIATTDVAGNTLTIAPNGRIAQTIGTAEPARLNVQIGRNAGQTLFVRGGWRFGPGCLAALAGLCGWAAFAGRAESRRNRRNLVSSAPPN